jgi:hypothetical protein
MTYTCKDCSHTSSKKFPNGKCPACDSYNISSTNKLAEPTTKERKPKTMIEIVILVLLWGLIAYGAWDKYYPHAPSAKPKTAHIEPKIVDPTLNY